MGELKSRQLAMIFTGSFLGAGFVSGQEIMQFFGVFGNMGIAGMLLAVFLFCAFGYIFMVLANKEKTTAIDKLILGDKKNPLHLFFQGISLFFLFGVSVIMLAGAGSLLNQLLGIPTFVGSALLAAALAVLSLLGMKSIVLISQLVVPTLLVLVVTISVWSLTTMTPAPDTQALNQNVNPLLGNWFFATLTFFSYNILASLAILTPAAQQITSRKTMIKGLVQGSVQLLAMIACIFFSLRTFYGYVADANFPMQALAERLNPLLGLAYAVLLLAAMFNGALACMFGTAVQLPGKQENNKAVLLILWVVALVCSLVGFKELISLIFPIVGYAYLIAIPFVLYRYFSTRKKEK